jgi:pimeloyl-ACP methyl ester carboxylesterase
MSGIPAALIHRTIAVNSVKLHVVESGEGDVVVLLHGFPEFCYSWRHQMRALADAGLRAVAPDLRGYSESDHPAKISSYRVNELVADIAALIAELRCGPVYLVGHDWGGLIAWRLAAINPELVRKLAILNAAHPAAYRRELSRNPIQWLKSYYVLLFQLPWLPEFLVRRRNFAAIERAWRRQPTRSDAFTDEDIAQYKVALTRSGLTGPINYYRAALRFSADLFASPQSVSVPTLVIWGEPDPFMSSSVNDWLPQWVPNLVVQKIAGASHWVQNDAPEEVNKMLIDFFSGGPLGS